MPTPHFTPERIDAALAHFRQFFRSERTAPLFSLYTQPDYRQLADREALVTRACACIQADAAGGEPDILPTFWPDFGTVSTAALWGGTVIPASEGGGKHITPAAKTLDDLASLSPRQSFEESDFGEALRLYRQVCERLETDQLFIRTPDLQGPMNTLALLIDQTELLCGMIEEPDLVAHALDHITDVLIDTVRRFRDTLGADKVVGNSWPYIVLPDGVGVSITQDYLPLLSPDLYETLELPRLKRIAETFGGVFIHCCGDYARHLPTLARAEINLLGIEAHYPFTRLWDVHAALGDRAVYTPYVSETAADEFPTFDAFLAHLRTTSCAQARVWVAQCHGWCDAEAVRRELAQWPDRP